MEKLNLALSSLKAVKDGHVSKSRVDTVGEAALKALKVKSSGEIAEVLAMHCKSSSPEQRLAAIYALHSVVYNEKKKIEEKNRNQRTEKRGELSIALESKLEPIFALLRDSSVKDREQVGKILAKWQDRGVFPADLVRKLAIAGSCAVPSAAPAAVGKLPKPMLSAPAYAPPSQAAQPLPPPPISVNLGGEAPRPLGAIPAMTSSKPASGGWGALARPAAAPPAHSSSSSRGRSADRRRPSPPREKRSRWEY